MAQKVRMLKRDLGGLRIAVSPKELNDDLYEPQNGLQLHFCLNRKGTRERILGKGGPLSMFVKLFPFLLVGN